MKPRKNKCHRRQHHYGSDIRVKFSECNACSLSRLQNQRLQCKPEAIKTHELWDVSGILSVS